MDILWITVVALLGGALPLLVKWTERHLHTALALSTGIFLGAVFLHLLPEVADLSLSLKDSHEAASEAQAQDGTAHAAEEGQEHDHDEGNGSHEHHDPSDEAAAHSDPDGASHAHETDHDHEHPAGDHDHSADEAGHSHGGSMWLWLCVLAGVLGVYFFESLALRTHDHDEAHRHKAVSYAALGGLSIHALTAGIAYAAVRGTGALSEAFLFAILAHKAFESFSLTTVFQLAEFSRTKTLIMVLCFSLVTPLGIVAGGLLAGFLGDTGLPILIALAAGTFLYVCLCELLTEVFHHREDSLRRIFLLIAGIALMVVVEGAAH